MGEQNVRVEVDEDRRRAFMRALLNEVQVLESMLDGELFERDIRRIGAEQELFLVDSARRPLAVASKALEGLPDPRFTHELAEFNLEANLSPQPLGGDCLSRMENEAHALLAQARDRLKELGGDIVLCGCLPTLKHGDLTIDNMVQVPRYFALNEELRRLRGSDFRFSIKGIDQLDISHENFMLEACNTSFQVHFQVAPDEFAQLYNIAQAVTGPVLAAAVNSPLLFAKRLWQETRISIFEFSVDTRSDAHQARGHLPCALWRSLDRLIRNRNLQGRHRPFSGALGEGIRRRPGGGRGIGSRPGPKSTMPAFRHGLPMESSLLWLVR